MMSKQALIIANRDYNDPKYPRLESVTADATALARVLRNPRIGDFRVKVLRDKPSLEIKKAIERFFTKAHKDDFLLLHFSCHGHRTPANRLYFLTKTTESDLLASTAIEAEFVNDQMEQSPAGRILLWLDCCYSGAFIRGYKSRSGSPEGIDVSNSFSGKGHLIMTASTGLQFSYEPETKKILNLKVEQPALFTGAIIHGLESGEADKDEDGQISMDELYKYVFNRVKGITPHQTPTLSGDRTQGTIYIARSPRPSAFALAQLELERKMNSDLGFSFGVPKGWQERPL
jgi:molecular chaperone DnaK